MPAVHWQSHGPRERAGVLRQGSSALPPGREVLALSGAGKPAHHFSGASFAPSPAAGRVRPAPREFKPTTAFLRALERLSIPKGWPSLHLLEENLKERSRSCRAVAFHLEQSHFGAVEKKAESACSRETLTPVGLGGSVEGEERGRKEKKEGRKEKKAASAATEYYNLFPEPEVFPIHSEGEEDEAQPFGEEPRQAEPASGSAQPGGEEAQRARPLRAPPVPTPQMVAEHEVTHIPYRSWCPACVAGRGRSYSHHHEGRDSTVPVISADYLYFSEKGVPGKSLPTVVLRDRASKAIFSHLLPTKGTVGSTYPEKAVLRDLNWLGYKRLVLKTDQENAIKALGAAVKAGFPEDLTLEESPKGDSHGQSNGTAENAVQRVQGQVRTMKYALEQSVGGELPKDSVIFPWMIEYAGVLHTLFSQEDSEGMTPFQKLKGRTWQIALPSFGEIVDYRRRAKSKLDARWQEGVYLGLRLTSSEKIIGTPSGILVVQSIRRKPADKQLAAET